MYSKKGVYIIKLYYKIIDEKIDETEFYIRCYYYNKKKNELSI